MASNSFKVKNSLVLTPKDLSTLTSPEAGDLACDINDSNKIKRYDAASASWVEVGSGGGVGGVDIFFVQDFESASLSSFTQTGLVLSQTDPLKGKISAVLTHQVGTSPTADRFFKQVIPVDRKFRGQTMVLRLDAKSNASAGNLVIKITNETASTDLVVSEQLEISNDVNGAKSSVSFTIPESCASLSYTITALPEAGSPVSRIDDIICELAETALLETAVEVPNVTAWQGYTPTFQGFGTPSAVEFEWRQVGENVEIRGKFTTGTPTAVEARIGLPAGLTSAGTSLIPSTQICGVWSRVNAGESLTYYPLITPSQTYITVTKQVTPSTTSMLGSGFSASEVNHFFASVPCSGLSATTTKTIPLTQSGLVQEGDSSLIMAGGLLSGVQSKIDFSNIIQNIGSDISYNNTTREFTVNSSGIYTISITDESASATTNTVTIRIFTNGVQRVLTTEDVNVNGFRVSTATSAYLNAGDLIYFGATNTRGSGGERSVSITKQGSLKQIAVSSDQKLRIPTSELRFEGASARGTSPSNTIVKFDTIAKIRGDAFTVNNDPVLGTSVVMKKAGRLNVSVSLSSGVASTFAISRNQASLTAQPSNSETIVIQSIDAGTNLASAGGEVNVNAGDVIRIWINNNPTGTANSLNLSFQEQDISVSVTNTLPQFSESDSSVRVDTANGYGSFGTKIRRFSNVRDNIGSDILYVPSDVNGDSFVVKSAGLYSISYQDNFTVADFFGISKNASSLTTAIESLSAAERLTFSTSSASATARPDEVAVQAYLNTGDIIRPHCSAAGAAGANSYSNFFISKVGKPNVTGVDVTPFVNVPQPVSQYCYLGNLTSLSSVNISGALTTSIGSGILSYNSTTGVFTALKSAKINCSYSATNVLSSSAITITINSTVGEVARATAGVTAGFGVTTSAELQLTAGQTFSFAIAGNSGNNHKISVLAEALSDQILTAPESFSTDTASLTYVAGATSVDATLANLATRPVGSYTTFIYPANSNSRQFTTTRPTQTDADMNANGIRIFSKAYNSASDSAGLPSAFAIQIGKGLRGVSKNLYKSTGKVVAGSMDYGTPSTSEERGFTFQDYNEVTGILLLDAGQSQLVAVGTNRTFIFVDQTSQTSGYLVINASKNPALTGMNVERVSARGVNTAGTSFNSTASAFVLDSNKTYDTHGALNTANCTFIAPESGYYTISASCLFQSAAYATSQGVYFEGLKNGVRHSLSSFVRPFTAATNILGTTYNDQVYLTKGDSFQLTLANERGATSLNTATGYNYFSITKTNIGGRN